MRRMLAVLVMAGVALMAGTAVAQDSGLVAKGVKAGVSLATFGGDDVDMGTVSAGTRTGLAVGGFLTFAMGPNFAFQPELLYVQKGAKYEEGDESATFKFAYLDIPLLLKARFPTSGSVRPNLFAGPVGSLKLSADGEATEGDLSMSMDISDMVKGFDFGMAFGGGLDFAMGQNTLSLDARYTLGLTDWPDTDFGDGGSAKNQGWLITLGLGF